MRNECNIIRDILPLYVENMVSDDTAAFIEDHLKKCAACRAELEQMKAPDDFHMDTDIVPLKNLKQKMAAKKILTIFSSVVLTLIIVFTCINLWPASIDYGTSDVYSRQDMNEAIDLIKEKFYSWDGCKLYSINYTDDNLCQRELEYCNTLAEEGVTYDECIVFRMQFRSPIFGGGAWNANFRYDWSWYLARTDGGEWELLTWGAP